MLRRRPRNARGTELMAVAHDYVTLARIEFLLDRLCDFTLLFRACEVGYRRCAFGQHLGRDQIFSLWCLPLFCSC